MEEYIFCYKVKIWSEDELKKEEEKGVVIAPDMSGALKKIEGYYGDPLGVTIEYLDDDFCDCNILPEPKLDKAKEQLERL